MASFLDLIGRGGELISHSSEVAAREAEAAARAEQLQQRAARVAAAQTAEANAQKAADLQRQMEVAQAAERLRNSGRVAAPSPKPSQAAQASSAKAAETVAETSAPSTSRLGQAKSFLSDAVTGQWGKSIGTGLGEMLGANESIKQGLGKVGQLGAVGVTLPWALMGAGKGAKMAYNVGKSGWNELLGDSVSPQIVHEDEEKRRKKLNSAVMGGLTDWHASDNDLYVGQNDENVNKALDNISPEDYKSHLSQILRGGDAKGITNAIARAHGQASGKWTPKGIVHLPGTIQSKGGQKFNVAINYDSENPEIIKIPQSDENNSRGGIHFGTLDEWDQKNSK